jgi:hypothetical protein
MLKISNVSADVAVAIFRANMYWLGVYQKFYIGQAVRGELEVMVLIGGAEERAAIQLEMGTWLKKRGEENIFMGHVVRRGD